MNCIICGSWFASTIHDGACPTCSRVIKQLRLNMTANRLIELARAEKDGQLIVLPPNDPLTLEELREMDGEPVWITAKGIGRYDVYQGCANRCLEQFYKAALPSSSYGTDWLAYRRKPEQGNHCKTNYAIWAKHLQQRFERVE